MATLHQQVERFLIYIATSFLCAIVLAVPLIIVVILFSSGSKNPDPINFEPDVVDNPWNLVPLEDAIKKTQLESFEFTEKPDLPTFDEVPKEKPEPIRAKIEPDMAGPNCPTCPYTRVSKYFKFSKFGCPDFLNTPECCYCGRPTPPPVAPRVPYNPVFLDYKNTSLGTKRIEASREQYNDTIHQVYYPHDICGSCTKLHQLSWIQDGQCDESLNNKECCYDGGDCKNSKKSYFNQCLCYKVALEYSFAETSIHNLQPPFVSGNIDYELFLFTKPRFEDLDEIEDQKFTKLKMLFHELGNGFCRMDMNTEACCWDGGDCLLPYQCPTCPVLKPLDDTAYSNWKMDPRNLLEGFKRQEAVADSRSFSDGVCDEQYNSAMCCWDGGDCLQDPCPLCPLPGKRNRIGDGTCDESLNNEECCFDAGDCSSVISSCSDPTRVNNGICDLDLLECGLDGGDCRGTASICPTCLAPNAIPRLANEECDQDLNNLFCCYDGGDCQNLASCPTCQSFAEPYSWKFINDGVCDRMNNFPDCCYDGDDCSINTDETVCRGCNEHRRKIFPHIAAEISHLDSAPGDLKYWLNQFVTKFKDGGIGDGQCHIALNVPECCFDGGDCIICPTCDPDLRIHVNDGICDVDLLKADCCFDHGDCDPEFANPKCFTDCTVPGLTPDQLKYFLTNGVCDHPLNNADCCFDNGECLGEAETCQVGCPASNLTRLSDGICDEELNNIMCCYDNGDCPFVVNTEVQIPDHCVTDTCFIQNYGDGICDKDVDDQICCNDKYDCIDTSQRYEDLPCSKMSTWSLFDSCPLCCRSNTSSASRELMNNICPPELLNPECCWGNCLEHLSECPTCPVKDYVLNINDGFCDDFLNTAECCFDFEDCVKIEYLNYVPSFDSAVGSQQKKNLLDSSPNLKFRINGLLSNSFCDATWIRCYSTMQMFSNVGRPGVQIPCPPNNCPHNLDKVGDHICDPEIAKQKDCCYDKGDCSRFDITTAPQDVSLCPTCPASKSLNLADGLCDEQNLNEECCFDLGDCMPTNCTMEGIVNRAAASGVLDEDNRAFFIALKQQTYGQGFERLITLDIGDKICNQMLNSYECYFDGWDCRHTLCSSCAVQGYMVGQRLANGVCDEAFNTLACCYDGGDCKTSDDTCESCDLVHMTALLGDGICQKELNTEECCRDFGDCSKCTTCDLSLLDKIGNQICDDDLNIVDCCFDGGDCEEFIWESKHMNKPWQYGNDRYHPGFFAPRGKYFSWEFDKLDQYGKSFGFGHEYNSLSQINNQRQDRKVVPGISIFDETNVLVPKKAAKEQIFIEALHTGAYMSQICQSCFARVPHDFDKLKLFLYKQLMDGVCDLRLNTAECCFDGGDCGCPTCPADSARSRFMADTVCDAELNSAECCYDGGDCTKEDARQLCPQCPMWLLQDLISEPNKCHEHLNNPKCCYSGGNCHNSSIDQCHHSGRRPHLQKITSRNFENKGIFRGCPLHLHKYLGDGVCDPVVAPFEEMCCYDGGDCIYEFWDIQSCNTCPFDLKHYIPLLKKNLCVPELNNFECCYSLGNCAQNCETCSRYNEFISDGVCDDVLNHEECCFDGQDCQNQLNCTLNCPMNTKYLGDGVCDMFLATPECCYDAGDCLEAYQDLDGGPHYPVAGFGFNSEPALEQVMWFGGTNPLKQTKDWKNLKFSKWMYDPYNAIGRY